MCEFNSKTIKIMMPVKKLNRLPSVFGDLFYDQWPDVFVKRGTTPPINVIETDKKFKVEIAAPGMTKDDFKIELNGDNQLIVCLEKAMERMIRWASAVAMMIAQRMKSITTYVVSLHMPHSARSSTCLRASTVTRLRLRCIMAC